MNRISTFIVKAFPWLLVLILLQILIPINKILFNASILLISFFVIHILGKNKLFEKFIGFVNYKPGKVGIQITNQEKLIIAKNKARHFELYYSNSQGIGVDEEIIIIMDNLTENYFHVLPDTLRVISEICQAEVHFQHYNQQIRTEVFIGSINLVHKINDIILDYYDQVKPSNDERNLYQQHKGIS